MSIRIPIYTALLASILVAAPIPDSHSQTQQTILLAQASTVVDAFVGNWSGNWDGNTAYNSTLKVAAAPNGGTVVTYSFQRQSWNYAGIIQDGRLIFSGGGYYFTFNTPHEGKMQGGMNGPNNILSRITMVRQSGASAAPAAPTVRGPDIQAETFVPPPAGTRVVYRTLNNSGGTGSYTRIIQHETYNGQPVFAAASPDNRGRAVFNQGTGAWIADLLDGKLQRASTPSSMDYQWPLQIGKNWAAKYDFTDHLAGKSWAIAQNWAVEATETVTVPAGTFDTFRLQSIPVQNVAVVTTRWYAPSLGVFVKQRAERDSSHYQGPGWTTTELAEYTKP